MPLSAAHFFLALSKRAITGLSRVMALKFSTERLGDSAAPRYRIETWIAGLILGRDGVVIAATPLKSTPIFPADWFVRARPPFLRDYRLPSRKALNLQREPVL